jgi:hypothetical protein
MCISCSCGDHEHRHPGSHSLVWSDIRAAAEDAGISPKAVAWNIVRGTNAMSEQKAKKEAPSFEEFLASVWAGALGCEVFKSSEERRYTLGVAYAANRADPHRGADGFRDFAGPEVLEKAAWSFIRNGASIGLDHAGGTDGAGRVVESYLYRGPDWPQDNGYVVKAGDWLLGVVWEPEAWVTIKSGQRAGYSMQGGARRRQPAPETLAGLRES